MELISDARDELNKFSARRPKQSCFKSACGRCDNVLTSDKKCFLMHHRHVTVLLLLQSKRRPASAPSFLY